MFRDIRIARTLLLCTLVVLGIVSIGIVGSADAQRPAWETSRVQGSPTPPLPFRVERVFGQHQFKNPVEFTNAPGTDSMFLLEQGGKIFELTSENDGEPRLVGDLAKLAGEFHMSYGLDFHPKFETNREIYVCYKRKGDAKVGSVVARFRLSASQPFIVEPDSEEILYTWPSGGHNGGCVKFGPDGCLYVSAGDSAAPFPPDPLLAGQDMSTLLSKITRIDVDQRDGDLPYGIPDDNPFAKLAGARPEIYAYGFRNPWRFAFDRKSGDMWAGDVGWELWEMIFNVESGGNYGWSIVEGPKQINTDQTPGPTPILKPAAAHSHAEARSITGGQVYHGDRLPELAGAYIYGDHVTGRIWSLRKQGDQFDEPREISRSLLQIICFGTHNNGELYVVGYEGTIGRLVPSNQDQTNQQFPQHLSESGLFRSVQEHALTEGVLPYSVIAEPWMDGATAQRFIGLPGDTQIGVYQNGGGHAAWDGKHRGSWKFPKDSVLGKTISLRGRRIETQLLHYDGQAWLPYTYIWNEAQDDASLAEDASQTIEIDLDGETKYWPISNRGDCMVCHTNANDMVLGFKPNQLRRPIDGQAGAQLDQLDHFASLGLFLEPPRNDKVLSNPHDASADLEARARSYLHVNCAFCHRPEGGGNGAIDLRFKNSLQQTKLVDQLPLQGSFGIEDARVISPGKPLESVLLYRLCTLGPGHMPKLGGIEVDPAGTTLLHDWIADLPGAQEDLASQPSTKELRAAASNDARLADWLSNVSNSMLAAHAIRSEELRPELREKILTVSRELPDAMRDLFECFIPVEQRTERLGDAIDSAQILAVVGDATRGKAIFLSESLSCKSCHAVEPGVASVGPNLSELPKTQYLRNVVLDNILHPSKEIKEEYHTHVIQTVDGNLYTGTVAEDEKTIQLRDAQNMTHTIPVADVEFRKSSDVSIMPEKLLSTFTIEQARDLIEFISSHGGS